MATATLAGNPPADFAADLATVGANAAANFNATVMTLLSANPSVKLVVETTPDVRQVPIVAQFLTIPQARQAADAVAAVQSAYNAHIRDVAALSPRVALADLASLVISTAPGSPTTIPFGGTTFRLTTTGDDFRDAVLADRIHPGTIAQGLIANAIVRAADTLGARIGPLTAVQIVNRARFVANNFRTAR